MTQDGLGNSFGQHKWLHRGSRIERVAFFSKPYVYCLSGARSAAACQMLGRMGYTKVSNIGGIGGYPGPLAR